MGHEGTSHGATGDGLHHGGLDFDVAARVEEFADGAQHLSALDEDVADVNLLGFLRLGCAFGGSSACGRSFVEQRVHEEVDVAPAVAQLDVGETVVFLGQGEQGLGEKRDGLDVDGELVGAGAEEVAGDADVVAEVEKLVELEGGVADGVFADVDLEAHAFLLERGETGLALLANRHDASGNGNGNALGFELLARRGIVGGANLREGVGGGEGIGVGLLAEGGNLLEFLLPKAVEASLELGLEVVVAHSFAGLVRV